MIDVNNPISIYLDGGVFEQLQRVGNLLAASQFVPKHLQKKPQDCFLVVGQALRWGMDPFAVAQCTYVVHGSLGYEGKIVTAAINTCGKLENNLAFNYDGEGKDRSCTISGKLKGEDEARAVKILLKDVKTENPKWVTMVDQMLSYRGSREWARRHMPEAMLGIKSDDELQAANPINVTPVRPSRAKALQKFESYEENSSDVTEYTIVGIYGEIIKEVVIPNATYSNQLYQTCSEYLDEAELSEEEFETFKEYNEPTFEYIAQNDRQLKAINKYAKQDSSMPVKKTGAVKIVREEGRNGAIKWKADFLAQIKVAENRSVIDELLSLNERELSSIKKAYSSSRKDIDEQVNKKLEQFN